MASSAATGATTFAVQVLYLVSGQAVTAVRGLRAARSADAQLHDLRKRDEEGGLEAGFRAGAQQQHRPHLERHRPPVSSKSTDEKALLIVSWR